MIPDAAGRLARRTKGAASETYLYDGVDLVGEYDGAGALLRRTIHGPGIDEPIVIYTGTGTATKTWLYADHQGSVTATANSSGAPVATLSYGSFGEPNTLSGPAFRYTGQRLDPDSGLYYYKARWYSPYLGRFLQTDPIGQADDLNLYTYVYNDPLNFTDPTGECPSCFIGAAVNVGLGYTISKISGEDYTWKNALIDAGTGFVGAGVASKIATVSTHIGKRAVMNGATNAVLSGGATMAHNKVGGKSLTDGVVENAVLGFSGGSLGSVAADKIRSGGRIVAEAKDVIAVNPAGQAFTPKPNSRQDAIVRAVADRVGDGVNGAVPLAGAAAKASSGKEK